MVAEMVEQYKMLSTAYLAHSRAEDQVVFPMLMERISSGYKQALVCCSDDHERENQKFHQVQHLITQLQYVNSNNAEGKDLQVETVRKLKEGANQLKAMLLDHMWKEDTFLLPMIVKLLRPEELTRVVQNMMSSRPAETMQTILQLMATQRQRNADAVAAGPKVPANIQALLNQHKHLFPARDGYGVGAPPPLQTSSSTSVTTDVDTVIHFSETTRGSSAAQAGAASGGKHKSPTSFQRWGREDDRLLQAAASQHNCKNWKVISESVPGRNGVQCYHRCVPHLHPLRSAPLCFPFIFSPAIFSHACIITSHVITAGIV
jgi:iron-sulfur cluster repair protein YtfE (RIC family)